MKAEPLHVWMCVSSDSSQDKNGETADAVKGFHSGDDKENEFIEEVSKT